MIFELDVYIMYNCSNAMAAISVLMFLSIKANHAIKQADQNVTYATNGLIQLTLNHGNAPEIVN